MDDALFPEFLVVSLTSSLIIVFIRLLSPKLSKRFNVRLKYYIWLLIALRLLIPASLSIPGLTREISIPENVLRETYTHTEKLHDDDSIAYYDNDAAPHYVSSQSPIFGQERKPSVTDIAKWVWLTGCLVFLFYHIAVYASFVRMLKKRAQRPSDAILGLTHDALKEMKIKKNIQVLIYNGIDSPAMIGFFRPALVLPDRQLPQEGASLIIRHELTHLKRRDLWYKLFMFVVNAIQWFNPFVWMMTRQAGADLELCCDSDLLNGADRSEREKYAQTILYSMKRSRKLPVLSTQLVGGNNK